MNITGGRGAGTQVAPLKAELFANCANLRHIALPFWGRMARLPVACHLNGRGRVGHGRVVMVFFFLSFMLLLLLLLLLLLSLVVVVVIVLFLLINLFYYCYCSHHHYYYYYCY